ncbi:MAG: hypothetical protein ACO1OF_19375 [Adhaeribacter sp.]
MRIVKAFQFLNIKPKRLSYEANDISLGDEGLSGFRCAAFRRRRKGKMSSPNDQTGPTGQEAT